MNIELVSFDADQMLFDFKKVMHEAIEATVNYFSSNGLDIKKEQLIHSRDKIFETYSGQAKDMLDIRYLSFLEVTKYCSGQLKPDTFLREFS